MKKLKYIVMIFFLSTLLNAEVLSDIKDSFYEGDFKEIIRFDALHFTQEGIADAESKKRLKDIVKKVKKLQNRSKIKITLVGHSYKESDYYPKEIKNRIDINIFDINITDNKSVEYVKSVKAYLLDNGIDSNDIEMVAKSGKVLGFSDERDESADLSNRVMLAVYVLNPEDIDSDRDGVFDKYDKCMGTPRGVKVDKRGCPVDSDRDGVLDTKDRCPGTMEGVAVDRYGCPIDSDRDGVADYKDRCKNTPKGISVDPYGCPLKQTLKLNFKTNSDKILKSSYGEVVKFAAFLKKNPKYKVKIIGHTDSIGKASTNMALSIKRAEAVKNALVDEGVEASRIVTTGRGEFDPIASNRTEEGRRANRRIEIELFE